MTDRKALSLRMAVLQTGRAADGLEPLHGDYDAMCKALVGRTPDMAETFAVLDGVFPENIDDFDAFLITGSRHGVYEDHPWIPPLEQLIRDAYAAEKKIIGVCFGHQIMAQALGGRVEKSPKGWGVGAMDYSLATDAGERSLKLYAWHQDQVATPPPMAEVIARSDFCPYAGLRYEDIAISFQPHPEFTREYMHDLAIARRGVVLSEEMTEAAIATLGDQVDRPLIQTMLLDFLER